MIEKLNYKGRGMDNYLFQTEEKINELVDTLNKLTKEECKNCQNLENGQLVLHDKNDNCSECGRKISVPLGVVDPVYAYKVRLKERIKNLPNKVYGTNALLRQDVLDLIDKE